jgi:ABC-type transport system involved in cytochrome bd biosynthesis fused ATPase/permease subunit
MEGVQILNQYSECVNIVPNDYSLISAFCVAIVIAIIVALISKPSGFFRTICCILVIAMFVFPAVSILTTHICGDKVLETRADVIVSDDVSLKDFTKEYNIVEQRGDIYVVTKKTQQ